LVAYIPATNLHLLHFEIYKEGPQRTRGVALAKNDPHYGNVFRVTTRTPSPSKGRPSNSGTQYHIVVPYLQKNILNN